VTILPDGESLITSTLWCCLAVLSVESGSEATVTSSSCAAALVAVGDGGVLVVGFLERVDEVLEVAALGRDELLGEFGAVVAVVLGGCGTTVGAQLRRGSRTVGSLTASVRRHRLAARDHVRPLVRTEHVASFGVLAAGAPGDDAVLGSGTRGRAVDDLALDVEFGARIDRCGGEPDVGAAEEVASLLAQVLDGDAEGGCGEIVGVNRRFVEAAFRGSVAPPVGGSWFRV